MTGASSGLGIATAEGLARLGARVHLVVRDEAKGRRVLTDLRGRVPGAQLLLWRCDLSDLADVDGSPTSSWPPESPSTSWCTTPVRSRPPGRVRPGS